MKAKFIEKFKNKFSYHITGIKLLKYLHVIDSSIIPLSILNSLLNAAFPYIGIFISAEIIDLLIAAQYKKVFILAAILISADFITGMIISLLQEILKYNRFMVNREFTVLIRKKCLSLDYKTMTTKDVLDNINYVERMVDYNGELGQVLEQYVAYLSSLVSIITASVLVIVMCMAKPSSSVALFNFMAKAPVTAAAVILMIAFIFKAESYISAHYEEKQTDLMEENTEDETQFSYFLDHIFFEYDIGRVIRLFNMKNMIFEKYEKIAEKDNDILSRSCDFDNEEQNFNALVNAVFSLVSYAIVIVKIITKAISIGSFTKYTGALIQLNNNIAVMVKSGSEIRRRCNYLKGFITFMEYKSAMNTGSIPIEKRTDNVYEIEFHDVSFHYPDDDNLILDHVSCKLTLKNKMAVVGRNGAGKSTFIKLLCRLYDPTDGCITLNGIDIRKYDYKQYQSIFGVVFQDFKLFSFPVGENVAASKEVDEEKAWRCLDDAGVSERIKEMPDKLKTPLYKYEDDGVEISGGEAQKIAIARAIYKEAPFVILDEPTAALDPLSEAEIYSRFGDMTNDKTSIFISHRMSSCRFCDDIIVFDKGKIVERGSHDELLSKDKYYASLWKAQSRYYV